MLTLEQAKNKRVCRICENPHTPSYEDPFRLNYGKEYAHKSCLQLIDEQTNKKTKTKTKTKLFRIASAFSADDLTKIVNIALSNGWELYGYPTWGGNEIVQGLTKEN